MSTKIGNLKCSYCGNIVPYSLTWEELGARTKDFCNDECRRKYRAFHKKEIKNFDVDDQLMVCIRRHHGYWSIKAPQRCRKMGIANCLECTNKEDCDIPVGLYY